MISKSKIQEIRQLHQKKFRQSQRLFIAEGTKSVLEVVNSTLSVIEILAVEDWINTHQYRCGTTFCTPISPKELERISTLTTPQQTLAIIEMPHYTIRDIDPALPLLVLDNIQDPGNLGTLIRTADWFGFPQVLCSTTTVEFTNPKVIQASMGSFCRIKIVYADLFEYLSKIDQNRCLHGASMAGNDIRNMNFAFNDILVIGNEATGISPNIETLITEKVHIPSAGTSSSHAESLNASIAAAIAMFCAKNPI